MTFTELAFLPFLAIVLPVYWAIGDRTRQNAWILAASLLFYGWRTPWYVLLLAGTALIDYLTARGMERWPARKGWMLGISLATNLGLLAWFKYLDFFVENAAALLDALGVPHTLSPPGVPLPVGISFYTFQTMGYAIDCWRGDTRPRRSLLDYATFVTFFPQLVAGPVERANGLLREVESERRFGWPMFVSGVGLALWGAVQKVVVADTLALYVDSVFAMPSPSAPLVAAATVGFSAQILADFAGYSDMARGLGRMLGFELMENFRAPYLARSPSEFWGRWHISFSTWIRDNVYVPLGGARHGPRRRVVATWVAMLASGFWHGAAWHFVAWGAWHAAVLTGWRALAPRVPRTFAESPLGRAGALGLTLLCVQFGWLLFREDSLVRVGGWLTRNPLAAPWEEQVGAVMVLSVALAGAAVLGFGGAVRRRWPADAVPLPARTALWACGTLAVLLFSRDVHRDFLYFRF